MPQPTNIDVVSPNAWSDILADVLAEGIVYLGERGLLDFASVPVPEGTKPAKSSNPDVPERP